MFFRALFSSLISSWMMDKLALPYHQRAYVIRMKSVLKQQRMILSNFNKAYVTCLVTYGVLSLGPPDR